MLDLIIQCTSIAVFSFVYCNVLVDNGMILSGWYHWLKRKTTISDDDGNTTNHWSFKVLVGCAKCNAGQLALWLYPVFHCCDYNLVTHISFVMWTIFVTHLILRYLDE